MVLELESVLRAEGGKSAAAFLLAYIQETVRTGIPFSPVRWSKEDTKDRKAGNHPAAGAQERKEDKTVRQSPEAKAKAKEERAERYLRDYGDSILRLAYSYLHNREDAEDILQETLIKVLDRDLSFEGPAHEKAYLLSTAANLAKNRIDYNKIRQTDELEEGIEAEHREDLSFVWQAVKSLPENYREVIHLFYEEGYQTKEIADILGRKESTVRSDLKRARERLKTVLKEDYDFE